eukprot:IDg19028t1
MVDAASKMASAPDSKTERRGTIERAPHMQRASELLGTEPGSSSSVILLELLKPMAQ